MEANSVTAKTYAIHPLANSDLLAAAHICAQAMRDNPVHIQVFGASPALREHRLRRFFPGLLAYVYRKGSLYGAFANGTLVGVLGMLPPKNCKPSLRVLLYLLPTLLTSNSPVETVRLAIWLVTWARIDPPTPHWHLGPLAVTPAWQQHGVGTQLIEHAVNKGAGDSLYLETDRLTNMEFYEGFGFSVLAAPSILATPSWVMMRPPTAEISGG